MNELNTWLDENNFYTYSKSMPIPSHLIYDGRNGGKVYIPRSKEYKFLSLYSEELKKGTKLYYIEQRTKVYKFMVDVDITDNHYWSTEEIIPLVMCIQKTIKDFFGDNHSTVCCISSEKKKSDGIHTGIHLIWNDLYVLSETALAIRSGIIQKLKISGISLDKPWERVIDELIYTRVGYRMVGSDKMVNKIPENRELKPLFVMNSEGELRQGHYERLLKKPKDLVLETSIRYVLDTYKDSGMPIKIPPWLVSDFVNISKTFGTSHNYSVVSSKEHFLIEKFIRASLPKQYSKCFIKSVQRYPDNNLLITTTSRYCLNLGREHNSCGIYFFASSKGLYQKCLCPCLKLDNRKKGYCKDYTSDCYIFEDELRLALFPKSKKSNVIRNMFVPDTIDNIQSGYENVCKNLMKNT
jgi:hypothetical protein